MPDFKRLGELRAKRPLIHCISNIVTANDCANVALAVGASPIMAQAVEEMADISRASSAEVLNTGTPDEAKFDAALACARISGAEGRPVVIDPVGVGASPWRLRRVRELLEIPARGIVRVNLAEARALLSLSGREQGVDSPERASEDERAAILDDLEQACEDDLWDDGAGCWVADYRRLRLTARKVRSVRGAGGMAQLSVLGS